MFVGDLLKLSRAAARLGLLAGLAAVAVLLSAGPPGATAQGVIQPGVSIVNETGGQCTTNWVYDGAGSHAGEVFIGTAAHCVGAVGEEITLQTGTDGTPLGVIGEVAFISPNLDYSLIRIDDANLGEVSAAMKGHPEVPTGVSTTDTAAAGDIIQFSGNGIGFHLLPLTQESRIGILHFFDGVEWSALGPVTPGDSGGPAADTTDGNKALGVVDVICVGTQCLGAGGVAVTGLLEDAASFGFTVELRTV